MDPHVPVLALAYGTDLVMGDPGWFPHPVRAMGCAIAHGERVLRRLIPWERLAGLLLVVLVVGGSYAAAVWIVGMAKGLSQGWGFVASTILMATCLSTRDLALEGRHVFLALERNDMVLARQRVGRIVGRDTESLDRDGVVRAAVETMAESTLDGILSPLFFFVVGGVPLAMAYKAVNTLDSMIGHRSARYLRFGYVAATVDTWANWIPARLSPALFTLAAALSGHAWRDTWRCAWRDGYGGPVPNAGIPEAALAGALGVQIGGTNFYHGIPSEMPLMGMQRHPLNAARVRESIRVMYICSAIACVLSLLVLAVRYM